MAIDKHADLTSIKMIASGVSVNPMHVGEKQSLAFGSIFNQLALVRIFNQVASCITIVYLINQKRRSTLLELKRVGRFLHEVVFFMRQEKLIPVCMKNLMHQTSTMQYEIMALYCFNDRRRRKYRI